MQGVHDTIDLKQVDDSKKILGLGDTATLREIKKAYRELVKTYHPDKCRNAGKRECERRMKEINKAYNLLMEYCGSYRYSFTKKDVEDFYLKYMMGFRHDWMWGPGEVKEGKDGRDEDYKGI